MKIKIAVDVNLGVKKIQMLENLGYNVVVIAHQAEEDIMWVYKAWSKGAAFVVSNDSDVPRIIEREGYPMAWIDCPHDNPLYKGKLPEYIDQMIKFKLKVYKKILDEAV